MLKRLIQLDHIVWKGNRRNTCQTFVKIVQLNVTFCPLNCRQRRQKYSVCICQYFFYCFWKFFSTFNKLKCAATTLTCIWWIDSTKLPWIWTITSKLLKEKCSFEITRKLRIKRKRKNNKKVKKLKSSIRYPTTQTSAESWILSLNVVPFTYYVVSSLGIHTNLWALLH